MRLLISRSFAQGRDETAYKLRFCLQMDEQEVSAAGVHNLGGHLLFESRAKIVWARELFNSWAEWDLTSFGLAQSIEASFVAQCREFAGLVNAAQSFSTDDEIQL